MTISDDALFAELMQDVVPIEQSSFIGTTKSLSPTYAQLEKQKAALADVNLNQDYLIQQPVIFVDPYDVLTYKKTGVQAGVFKNLRLGKYQVDASLQLQSVKLNRAKNTLISFLNECQQRNIRTVLIRHGIGLYNQPTAAILKSYCAKWLAELPAVLAYYSAQKHHGGVGATYVLLTKSCEKKLENREAHFRKR
ncbi:DNA endonuclease SmrA [Pseudoalteromonas tunicata]|uniref:DNA endonuclease SmrA n=1 Tax=Pseudoalteromonas tunicata TaxID=314281 RepID=UPI00273FDAA9|nr:DNA endonuclease SmrA [Pseudoalteromonas tunicata]MDP5213014.1 DNA endonuclease SmrA [Pseudoalteromonas tunicata]